MILCWLLRCFAWLLWGFVFSQREYKPQNVCGKGGDRMQEPCWGLPQLKDEQLCLKSSDNTPGLVVSVNTPLRQ